MTAAISTIAPTSPRAANRAAAAAQDSESSPFASLLGADTDANRAPEAAETTSANDQVAEKRAETEGRENPEATPQLPAWLQALRAPTPLVGDAAAVVADPAEASALKGSSAAPFTPLTLEQLRNAKGIVSRPGDTPPTQTPPTRAADGRYAVTALAADTAAPPAIEVLPSAEITLDATQTAALDAAIAKLDTVPATATAPNPLPTADRSTPVTAGSATISDAAAASALTASLANQTDAFGEPLSLQGHDAALRLGERLRWLTEAGVQEARMQLHPRELGSVDIRIRIEGQGASVWFGADHPGARAALEATLPQLRERLASEGLQLTESSVGSQTTAQQDGRSPQGGTEHGDRASTAVNSRLDGRASAESGVAAASRDIPRRRAVGLLDRYA